MTQSLKTKQKIFFEKLCHLMAQTQEASFEEDVGSIHDWARQIVWNLQKDMTFWDHVNAFIAAVDWNETWILLLILSELLLLGFTVYTQQNWAIQSVLFILTC